MNLTMNLAEIPNVLEDKIEKRFPVTIPFNSTFINSNTYKHANI